jgi:hypothetical protein
LTADASLSDGDPPDNDELARRWSGGTVTDIRKVKL